VKIRYILGHNASSPHSHTSPNGYSRKDNDITSKPTIFTDCNRLAEFGASNAIAEEGIKWMGSAIERAIGSDESTGTHGDQADIEEGGVEVDVDTLTDPMKMSSL